MCKKSVIDIRVGVIDVWFGEECVLENGPLKKLAKDGELKLYRHKRFWACMDTQRDRDYLTNLWERGKAPWAQRRCVYV